MKRDVYKDDDLLEIVSDHCNFIIDQIVYYKGDYHNLLSDLGSNIILFTSTSVSGIDYV